MKICICLFIQIFFLSFRTGIVTMVFRSLFPVLLLLLWKPVYSALDDIDCCTCTGLELKRKPSNIQPNIYPSPFQILVDNKHYKSGGLSINGNCLLLSSLYFSSWTSQVKFFIMPQTLKCTRGRKHETYTYN